MSDTFDHELDALESQLSGAADDFPVKDYNIKCKYCGTDGLHWGFDSRLYNRADSLHTCQEYLNATYNKTKAGVGLPPK